MEFSQVKNHTQAVFEWCAFCFVTLWFFFISYIGSTDADAYETV